MENQKDHFDKIFWLLASAMALAFIYTYLITFIRIPEKNIRFADTAQGFLLGTVLTGILAYFIGGSPTPKKTPSEGTTTATIDATITSTPEQ
jgi:hypothetical protein